MKIRYTVLLVILFAILFVIGLKAEAAEHEMHVGVGVGVANVETDVGHQQIGYRYDGRWYAEALRTGGGETDDGATLEDNWRWSVGRYVHFRRDRAVDPFLRLGAAYWRRAPSALVGDRLTFDMAAGVELYDVVRVSWQHNSTAGRSEPNTGYDLVVLTLRLDI